MNFFEPGDGKMIWTIILGKFIIWKKDIYSNLMRLRVSNQLNSSNLSLITDKIFFTGVHGYMNCYKWAQPQHTTFSTIQIDRTAEAQYILRFDNHSLVRQCFYNSLLDKWFFRVVCIQV